MKKLFSYILILALILTVSTPAQTVLAATAKLNKSTLSLNVGKTYTLKLLNASGTVKWVSSNKKIVSITSKGIVKAISAGKATITAAYKDKKYKCSVTVKAKTVKIIMGAAIFDGTTTQDYAKQFQEKNPSYLSIKPYDDDHVVITMYESERVKLVKSFNASFQDYLDEILNTDGFEIFTDIKSDKLFKKVKIYTDKKSYSNSMAGLSMIYMIALISDSIQALNLIDVKDRNSDIQIIDQKTGTILYPPK